jgi:hypothetical protein
MKSGLRPRDEAFIDKVFAARKEQATAQPSELKSVVTDFEWLRNVGEIATRESEWEHRKDVLAAAKKELSLEQREEQITAQLAALEASLSDHAKRDDSFTELRDRLSDLARRASAKDDSGERRMARRVLRGTFVRSFEQIKDPDYQKLLDKLRAEQQ